MQLISAMPVKRVADIARVGDDKLWYMIDRYVKQTREFEDFSSTEAIGMDETSRAKGHDYITLFVDLKQRRTIYITKGKDSGTLKDFVKDLEIHQGHKESIKELSCDMSPAFIKGVKDNLPNAEITFDKFHIIKLINKAVDTIRKEESGEIKLLKGTKYLFLKNEKNLTQRQKAKLQEYTMPNMNLKTVRAYNIRKAFQNIYEAQTQDEFVAFLKKWYFWATHSRLEPIKKGGKEY